MKDETSNTSQLEVAEMSDQILQYQKGKLEKLINKGKKVLI